MFKQFSTNRIFIAATLAIGGLIAAPAMAQQPVTLPTAAANPNVVVSLPMIRMSGSSDATQQSASGQSAAQASLPDNPTQLVAYGTSGLPGAWAQLVASRMSFRYAEWRFENAFRDARRDFAQSNAYLQAQAAEKSASDAYQAACRKAIAPLQNNPEYQSAVRLRDRLSAQIADQHQNPKADQAQIIPLAKEKLRYARIASEMEEKLTTQDPAVQQAQQKLKVAVTDFAKLKNDFENSLRTNPTILAARQNKQQADIALAVSEAWFNGVVQVRNDALNYAYYLNRYDYPAAVPMAPISYGGYGYYGYGYSQPVVITAGSQYGRHRW